MALKLVPAARTALRLLSLGRRIPTAALVVSAIGTAGAGVAVLDAVRPAAASTARGVRAVDGDTLVATIDGTRERIRVLGIDTPETVKPGAPVGCYGPQASKRAKAWVKHHRTVKLRTDPAAPDRDRYGRLLRYVEPTDGTRDLSTVQLAGGYARLALYGQDLAKRNDFRAAQRTARRHHRGLWGACR